MGAKVDDHCESSSTPRLSLSRLPCKRREPIQMLTPPIHPLLSVPFRWEEVPGKPRAAAQVTAREPTPVGKSKVARCLDLPPILLRDDAEIMNMPSPATVLDGPYVGRSLSLACTFSFRKGVVVGRDDIAFEPVMTRGGGRFGSGRWGSFNEEEKVGTGRGNFDLPQTLGGVFKREKNVKITRVERKRKRRSLFNLPSMNSNLLDIYASFKKAVSWRCRR
ncbi:hypothetical protein OROGR_010982 [Orobanche gracilis]